MDEPQLAQTHLPTVPPPPRLICQLSMDVKKMPRGVIYLPLILFVYAYITGSSMAMSELSDRSWPPKNFDSQIILYTYVF
jgi:hypothetical protein